jgi:hypothetical protein
MRDLRHSTKGMPQLQRVVDFKFQAKNLNKIQQVHGEGIKTVEVVVQEEERAQVGCPRSVPVSEAA